MRWRFYLLPSLVALVYLFLYLPIMVLAFFSFNDNPLGFAWKGFTFRWYGELLSSREIWVPLKNSLIVSTASVVLSVSMALSLALFIKRSALARLQPLFYLSLAIPEIVLAVGLLICFQFFAVSLGLTTLIAAHTLIGLGYAVPLMYTRLSMIDQSLLEASLDLGATYVQTMRRVVMPLLMPAVTSSALLVFIVSFDEFVLSFFCAGGDTQTLPMYIFANIRTGNVTLLGAFSTALLVVTSLCVLFFSFLQARKVEYFQ